MPVSSLPVIPCISLISFQLLWELFFRSFCSFGLFQCWSSSKILNNCLLHESSADPLFCSLPFGWISSVPANIISSSCSKSNPMLIYAASFDYQLVEFSNNGCIPVHHCICQSQWISLPPLLGKCRPVDGCRPIAEKFYLHRKHCSFFCDSSLRWQVEWRF